MVDVDGRIQEQFDDSHMAITSCNEQRSYTSVLRNPPKNLAIKKATVFQTTPNFSYQFFFPGKKSKVILHKNNKTTPKMKNPDFHPVSVPGKSGFAPAWMSKRATSSLSLAAATNKAVAPCAIASGSAPASNNKPTKCRFPIWLAKCKGVSPLGKNQLWSLTLGFRGKRRRRSTSVSYSFLQASINSLSSSSSGSPKFNITNSKVWGFKKLKFSPSNSLPSSKKSRCRNRGTPHAAATACFTSTADRSCTAVGSSAMISPEKAEVIRNIRSLSSVAEWRISSLFWTAKRLWKWRCKVVNQV